MLKFKEFINEGNVMDYLKPKSEEEIKTYLTKEYGENTSEYFKKLVEEDILDRNDPMYKKYLLEDTDLNNTILFKSIRNSDVDLIKRMAEWGIDLNQHEPGPDKTSTLMVAITENNNLEVAELLLKLGVSPEIESDWSWKTSLIWSCEEGYDDVVELLLKYNADINHISGNKLPLMVATENGYTEIVELLLNADADTNIQTRYEWTSLMIACRSNRRKIAELLLNAGADINMKNDHNKTAIDYARPRMLEIIKKYDSN